LNVLAQFDQVFVINLDSRPDRLREMRAQLRSIGFDFDARIQRFPAVKVEAPGAFRSIGARGCFLSHLGCLEKARQLGARSMMILEDDADFSPDFRQRRQSLEGRLRLEDWGMFYGGGHFGGAALPAQSPPGSGFCLVPADTLIWTAHCMSVREPWLTLVHDYLRAMLGRSAGHADGGPMDVDGAYSWFRRVNQVPTLMALPEIAVQRSSSSDITPQWFDQVGGLGTLVRRLRALRRGLRG
jgi:glycosyl transferase family 25